MYKFMCVESIYKSITYSGKCGTLLVNQAVFCLDTVGCMSVIIFESMGLQRNAVYMLQYNPTPLITYVREYGRG